MSKDMIESLTGTIVNDNEPVSLIKLSQCCDLSVEKILIMVEFGIIEPLDFQTSHIRWQFTGSSVLRVQTVTRLQRDLDVNLAGAALALDLLDEIKTLRRVKGIVE